MVVERSEDFVAGGEELGLAGVVDQAAQLDVRPRAPVRTAWVKHKPRREERFAMTGVRRTSDGVAEAVFVARALPDGSLVGESTGQAVRGVGYG